jgi:ribosomal protein S18 acetylase RimI-like enzyme
MLDFSAYGIGSQPGYIPKSVVQEVATLDKICFGKGAWGFDKVKAMMDQSLTIVCRDGTKCVGALSGRLFVHEDTCVGFYINSCAVLPSRQMQGIGRKMINKLKNLLRSSGVELITLYSLPSAIKFYVACGFKPEGIHYVNKL